MNEEPGVITIVLHPFQEKSTNSKSCSHLGRHRPTVTSGAFSKSFGSAAPQKKNAIFLFHQFFTVFHRTNCVQANTMRRFECAWFCEQWCRIDQDTFQNAFFHIIHNMFFMQKNHSNFFLFQDSNSKNKRDIIRNGFSRAFGRINSCLDSTRNNKTNNTFSSLRYFPWACGLL